MGPDRFLSDIFRLSETQKKALNKLGVETVEDLFYHFPFRYGDVAGRALITDLEKGKDAVIFGRINKLKTTKAFHKKIPMGTAELSDDTGKIKIVWFNQPYLAKMISEDSLVRVEGRVSKRKEELYFSNPQIEKVTEIPNVGNESLFKGEEIKHSLNPVYPESRGISSNWILHAVYKLIKAGAVEWFSDPLPTEILKKYHLPSIKTALVWMHVPQKIEDSVAARKRFAFEEVFFIQLEKQRERALWRKEQSFIIEKGDDHVADFIKRFPFSFTNAQNRAISAILSDFRAGEPMARLLEGDVGSGKTAVAASTSYAVVTSRPKGQNFGALQVAYMCPTEILARQQFDNFISFFSHLTINIGLITSAGCQKFPSKVSASLRTGNGATDISRSQLLKWVANGEIPILVGTHSLIQKAVKFKHLAYVIIDEQHRFGVSQRKSLVHKEKIVPHLLSMTATPIPRTLALTVYGDLDLTLLDELPPGRKPVITEIVAHSDRGMIYEKIREELKKGRQCYVITPRIDEPDPEKEFAIQARSAKAEAKRLKKEVFPEFEIEVMHSKLKDADKERVMNEFRDGKINILVSTSVIEVGVNIPNATVIVIEGADRFGLAQLHQLRGRVLRSTHQSYCYVFAETAGEKTFGRLKALQDAKNGFELAEYDLQFRGAGELYGKEQWGVSDVAMEALKNLKMVEAARAEAKLLLEEDESLKNHPAILAELERRKSVKIHFE